MESQSFLDVLCPEECNAEVECGSFARLSRGELCGRAVVCSLGDKLVCVVFIKERVCLIVLTTLYFRQLTFGCLVRLPPPTDGNCRTLETRRQLCAISKVNSQIFSV